MTSEPTRGIQPSADDAGTPRDRGQAGVTLPTHRVRRTRTGGVWVAAALFALILLLLLIFILENGQRVSISYFGAHGHLPLGVALLLAAVIGVLLVVIPGTGRIIQLRITARRHRRLDAQAAAAAPAVSAQDPSSAGQTPP
jgi:lipopolysaccharide assembly protein A